MNRTNVLWGCFLANKIDSLSFSSSILLLFLDWKSVGCDQLSVCPDVLTPFLVCGQFYLSSLLLCLLLSSVYFLLRINFCSVLLLKMLRIRQPGLRHECPFKNTRMQSSSMEHQTKNNVSSCEWLVNHFPTKQFGCQSVIYLCSNSAINRSDGREWSLMNICCFSNSRILIIAVVLRATVLNKKLILLHWFV